MPIRTNYRAGQKQRVMIAMAMSCNPSILIADEPTTALDVTVQATILDLMAGLKGEIDSSIMFITHDLGVIAEIADRVLVMYKEEL
jgi:ABC-type dipeptide/oligopeptide/nickel transport system ATPase component